MSEKIELKELNEEELEKVTGGSHVDAEDIHKYVGRRMLFSYGPWGWSGGPYLVLINKVNGTWVNMTFIYPEENEKVASNNKLIKSWKNLGNCTWEFNYAVGCTWLE